MTDSTTASSILCSQCNQPCGGQYAVRYPPGGCAGKPWCYTCLAAASIRAAEDERILDALVHAVPGKTFTARIRNDGHLVLTYIDKGHEDEPHVFVVAKDDLDTLRQAIGLILVGG